MLLRGENVRVRVGRNLYKVRGVIHVDEVNDTALLKLASTKVSFQPMEIGDINKLKIGEKIFVIGNALGFVNTISDGLFSGLRWERWDTDKKVHLLQITAPISPGLSGGPVINSKGEVVGIIKGTIQEFPYERTQNLNFATPINLIQDKIGNTNSFPLFPFRPLGLTRDLTKLFPFGGGILLMVLIRMVRPLRSLFGYWQTFEHELVHLITSKMFGGKFVEIKVGLTGNQVIMSKTNFFVRLAPYIFPLYSILIVGFTLLVRDEYKSVFVILAGVFYGNFLLKNLNNFSGFQPDLQKSGGKIIAGPFILSAHVLVLIGMVLLVGQI